MPFPVAAATATVVRQDQWLDEFGMVWTGQRPRLTDTELAAAIHSVTGVVITPAAVKSLRFSAINAIGDFLDHRRAGRIRFDPCPLLSAVLGALSDPSGSAAFPVPTGGPAGALVALRVVPSIGFAVQAHYSDASQAALYRAAIGAALTGPEVKYRNTGTPTRRPGTRCYAPDVAMGDISIKALFDRMILRVTLPSWRPFQSIRAHLRKVTKESVYVEDLTERQKFLTNRFEGGILATGIKGQYDITLQTPTPESITAVIQVLKSKLGMTARPKISLLELSVDFQAVGTLSASDQLRLREQMVTVPCGSVPSNADRHCPRPHGSQRSRCARSR